jgi:hypothetical protein
MGRIQSFAIAMALTALGVAAFFQIFQMAAAWRYASIGALSAIAILVSVVFAVVALTAPRKSPALPRNAMATDRPRSIALALVMFGLGFTAYVQISHLGATWRTLSIAATGLASVCSSLIFFRAALRARTTK